MKLLWSLVLSNSFCIAMEQQPGFNLEKIKELPQPLQQQIFICAHKKYKNPMLDLFRLDCVMPNSVAVHMIDEVVEKFDPIKHVKYIAYLNEPAKSERVVAFYKKVYAAFHRKYLAEIRDNFFNVAKLLPRQYLEDKRDTQFIAELSQAEYGGFLSVVSLYTFMQYMTNGEKLVEFLYADKNNCKKIEDNLTALKYWFPHDTTKLGFNFFTVENRFVSIPVKYREGLIHPQALKMMGLDPSEKAAKKRISDWINNENEKYKTKSI